MGYWQWNGFITLYATESSVIAEAAPGSLNLTYPIGNGSSIFTLLISPFAAKKTISTIEEIQGLTVSATGSVNETYRSRMLVVMAGLMTLLSELGFTFG